MLHPAIGNVWAAGVLFCHQWVESLHVNVTQVPVELSVTFTHLGQGSDGNSTTNEHITVSPFTLWLRGIVTGLTMSDGEYFDHVYLSNACRGLKRKMDFNLIWDSVCEFYRHTHHKTSGRLRSWLPMHVISQGMARKHDSHSQRGRTHADQREASSTSGDTIFCALLISPVNPRLLPQKMVSPSFRL